MTDEIVGHKTLLDGQGNYSHIPLYKTEADELLAGIKQADEKRKVLMPDEESAISMLFNAQLRLKELGWKDVSYCPKDGIEFTTLELGSTGQHRCRYDGEWPNGHYWVLSEGDLWPSRPILFKPIV
jgi:hypothetical protein